MRLLVLNPTVDRESVEYVQPEDILRIYSSILRCSVETASDQLRSPDGLESAVARPRWHALYLGADFALQAAVLAHGIAETQPFVEGNKRTALLAMWSFLYLNGYLITAPQDERAAWMLRVAEGMAAENLAEMIRASLAPASRHPGDPPR